MASAIAQTERRRRRLTRRLKSLQGRLLDRHRAGGAPAKEPRPSTDLCHDLPGGARGTVRQRSARKRHHRRRRRRGGCQRGARPMDRQRLRTVNFGGGVASITLMRPTMNGGSGTPKARAGPARRVTSTEARAHRHGPTSHHTTARQHTPNGRAKAQGPTRTPRPTLKQDRRAHQRPDPRTLESSYTSVPPGPIRRQWWVAKKFTTGDGSQPSTGEQQARRRIPHAPPELSGSHD